jgi:prepilin-type N-terminal cleavage/methylation domain-containing protein
VNRARPGPEGFTLVELLAVIAVILLLLVLLFPALQGAQESVRSVLCKTNLRTLALATIVFAQDHDGALPGVYGNTCRHDADWKWEIFGTEVALDDGVPFFPWMYEGGCAKNHPGSLVRYTGVDRTNSKKLYRCPSLRSAPFASGRGSNGMFDYGMIKPFGGASLTVIPPFATLYRGRPEQVRMPTPFFAEEDPLYCMNAGNLDPGHSNVDRVGVWHRGWRGNYVSVIGSVQTVGLAPDGKSGPLTWDWSVQLGDRILDIADPAVNYGRWGQ